MKANFLIGHPTGNQFFIHASRALNEAGNLSQFWTCFGVVEKSWLDRMMVLPILGEFRRRQIPAEYRKILHTQPSAELLRLLSQRLGLRALYQNEFSLLSIDQIFHRFDRKISRKLRKGKGSISHIYLYEDGALESFKSAKDIGISKIYDLPIAYWRESERLLKEEALRYPEWEPTLIGNRMSDEKKARKNMELELADIVICPSQFVFDSIKKHTDHAHKVRVVPFGTPSEALTQGNPLIGNQDTSPLKVLFAGTLTQRKGLADVFEAIKLIGSKQIQLHVIGAPIMNMKFYSDRCPTFIYHPTRPHLQVLELMKRCDVMLLPSIIEGRAQTQLEALACGLPLIVTRNAGAEDMVDEGESGFLVPAGSPERIAEKLVGLIGDRNLLESMKRAAQLKAQSWTWKNYREKLISVLS
jgi:glycosyltransferase involved in cell wall biosynthesis